MFFLAKRPGPAIEPRTEMKLRVDFTTANQQHFGFQKNIILCIGHTTNQQKIKKRSQKYRENDLELDTERRVWEPLGPMLGGFGLQNCF